MIYCKKNCNDCKNLNIRVDDKGYPYGHECMKYGDSMFESEFEKIKSFAETEKEACKLIRSL